MDWSGESRLVQRILDGDMEMLATTRSRLHPALNAMLLSRGATRAEAGELLADLWSDCVPGAKDGASLLEKYHGKCPLQAWLATVVTHRWVDLRRYQARHVPGDELNMGGKAKPGAATHSQAMPLTESALSSALERALRAAFAGCAKESLIMMRLVYTHGLTQREVGRMWGWHETKVSRKLKYAMAHIRGHTMDTLQQLDPWLHLNWEDLVEVCSNTEGGLFPKGA